MAEKSTLARPYAQAAFKQASEEGQLDQWAEMLDFLAAVASDRTIVGLISDPRIEKERLVELILGMAEGRLSKTGQNFVHLLAESGRLEVLPEIAEMFQHELAEFKGRGLVEVLSAFELEPRFRDTIKAAMSKRLGRSVDVSVKIDTSLIGGVILRAGDLVVDASVRGRLKELSLALH
jgi:F-type H+-transporting ATPase subunit delta